MKMILDLFAGGHSVTLYKDSHVTTFSASSTSDVQAQAEVTLTVVIADGYEVDEYEVIAGGVTVNESTKKFTMGSDNVVIYLKTKADNKYMVTEETMSCVNDTKVTLHANTVYTFTPNGVIKGVSAASGGASLTLDAGIQQLIDQGVVVKL